MAVTEGITYEELEGSPEFECDESGLKCVRQFRVPWGSWQAFANILMGTYATSGRADKAAVPLPGWPNCYCDSVKAVPFIPGVTPDSQGSGADFLTTAMNTYTTGTGGAAAMSAVFNGGARVIAFYRTTFAQYPRSVVHPALTALASTVDSDAPGTHLTLESDYGGEVMTIDGKNWKWVGAVPVEKLGSEMPTGVVIPTTNHIVQWFWVTKPPWATIRQTIGKVNSASFLDDSSAGNVGNVLFLGCQPMPAFRLQVEGDPPYRLIYKFSEQSKFNVSTPTTPLGWNYFWKEVGVVSGDHWVKIEADDAGAANPYLSAAFNDLFKFAT